MYFFSRISQGVRIAESEEYKTILAVWREDIAFDIERCLVK